MSDARLSRLDPAVQGRVGLALSLGIVAAWAVAHVLSVFWLRLSGPGLLAAPVLVALICWLDVGLFIVAHDAMHGSLVPFRPAWNRAIGRVCLMIYAGFSYDRLIGKHFDHHRHSGTELDPDFHAPGPRAFWPWYASFFLRYFGWTQVAVMAVWFNLYVLVLGASPANALLFWALPAVLASFQLFVFGTYLPHRHDDYGFGDRHNARSNEYPVALSLLTCFHFGYHHEHHEHPSLPWWRLPAARRVPDAATPDASTTPAARA